MMQRLLGRRRYAGDSGVALVAAIAVAIIGISITIVVIAQAVVATQDSARDRVRTIAVHSAESALDATMSDLAVGAPCPSPDWSPLTVGEGSTETVVEVVIQYFDADGEVSCSGGTLASEPTSAIVTTTSRPANPMSGGIQPERIFESEVNLIPLSSMIPGSALFSGGQMSTGGGFSVLVTDDSDAASVWVDSGNYLCDTNVTIGGNLYVVAGSATMNSGCSVQGDLWVRTGYVDNTGMSAPNWRVTGNTTVYNGTFTLSNASRFKGDLSVGGNINPNPADIYQPQWKNSTVGGTACANNLPTKCGTLTEYQKVGLPHIDLDISDWTPAEDGTHFTLKHKADLVAAELRSWGIEGLADSHWQKKEVTDNPCTPPAHRYSTSVKLPLDKSNTPTIYDMRDCATFNPNGGKYTLELYSDVAMFVGAFNSSNGFVVKSGDGKPHRFWLIVPWGSGTNGDGNKNIVVKGSTVNFKPGDINASSAGYNVDPLIKVFFYTPKTLQFPNTSTTYGQLYGGKVNIGSGNGKFYYAGVGVPGVNLTIPSGSAEGYRVEIVNKRELKN